MVASLALMLLCGMMTASLCEKIRLPRIIGMLLTGVLLGPYALNLINGDVLNISAQLRQIALIIILIKAGLSLNLSDLKKVGRPALLLSFLPACFEIAGCVLLAPPLLGVSIAEAAVIGAVLGAVSPAVVVPRMVALMEGKWGTEKSIPQMILAGASLDDVFVIVLFTVFCGMAEGGKVNAAAFLQIPVSILIGIVLGALCGWLLGCFFEHRHTHSPLRNSYKMLLLMAFAFLMMTAEKLLEGVVPVSGLLAVMSLACAVKMRCRACVSENLAGKFGKLWLGAQIMLFVLVGAAVDIRYTAQAGAMAVLLILLVLAVRCIGTALCVMRTPLNRRERLYCVLSYLPKATVQAAIGGVPLSMGLACGNTVLSIAVLSILITAPLGAIAMDLSYQKLLTKEE